MPKRHQREPKRLLSEENVKSPVNRSKLDHHFVLEIVVGLSNVKRWNQLRITFSYSTNEEFSSFLLELAEKYLKEKQLKSTTDQLIEEFVQPIESVNVDDVKDKNQERKAIHAIRKKERSSSHKKFKANSQTNKKSVGALSKIRTSLDEEVVEENKIKPNSPVLETESNFNNGKDFSIIPTALEDLVLSDSRISNILSDKNLYSGKKESRNNKEKENKTQKYEEVNEIPNEKFNKTSSESHSTEKQKKRSNGYDIRKAPELNKQGDSALISTQVDETNQVKQEVENRVAIKIKLCYTCCTRHIQDHCPLQNPRVVVHDSVSYEEWTRKYKSLNSETSLNNLECGNIEAERDLHFSYANISLPSNLCLKDSGSSDSVCVYASNNITEFTQFGPLHGKTVKEVDIPEDFNMKYLWGIIAEMMQIYINTEDVDDSNWIRFVRPAPTRDERNVVVVSKDDKLYLISIKNIAAQEELLYWQDDVINTKKRLEKTTCGGCNLTFAHPLYYRMHCTIFHDMRYSLTIRKYHCKVCGAAVLGKENIMKHAAELHNGQGAYQCQFCKKFFLRLNYLEMHRTYGCSANPHRSRPLCDFCGRKFCQPQKLKVHIKRMHSDLSEVLKEFQCKNCLKLLGSRAALQRHMKEVHNKQVNGSCACSRCGKLFQNKSNLKIHMLTHSGIKPFKCTEGNCNAAFTTKQCLQFHYKKVHGFTDDRMPKIARSVDYTFEAYSGVEDQETEINDENHENIDDPTSEENFINMKDISDEESSVEEKVSDDQQPLCSPNPTVTEQLSNSNSNPPTLEPYANLKILSKGSKKWLGEQTLSTVPSVKNDIYDIDKSDCNNINLDVDDTQTYEPVKLNINLNSYTRHESSNASLLVEAALDSVTDIHCSTESNININSSSSESLVNNLCTLTHSENLPDVSYTHSVDIGESRDINLISPSVNETISVTDGENLRIDYSSFHHNEFSPANSPDLQQRSSFSRDYIDVGEVSPHDIQSYAKTTQSKSISPNSSPPRYNFGHAITTEHISSDDSEGISAQNLSLHDIKNEAQLDLPIYKSPYTLDPNSFQFRKDLGMKFNLDAERKQLYILEINDAAKIYNDSTLNTENNLPPSESSDRDQVEEFDSNICNKDFENIDSDELKQKSLELKSKYHDIEQLTSDIRNKQFDLDLNLRNKSYDLTSRTSYEGGIDVDFRLKNYESIDTIDTRNTLTDTEFRLDRNFEPLVLNSTELQGLDMTSRSYHNYHNSTTVTNLNRYHHIYPDVERPSVDLRLNYSPPLPSYTHADVLRVVSLDLTSPGRHSVDLSLRSNPLHVHQLGNTRLLSEHGIQTNRLLTDHNRLTLDQSRLLGSDPTRLLSTELSSNRHLNSNPRLMSVGETGNRILSDHSTNRLLSNEQLPNHLMPTEQSRLISDETRLLTDQPRLLEQTRLLGDSRILSTAPGNGSVSPIPYGSYSVSPTSYHPAALTTRSHTSSPTPAYHHYSNYY